MKSPFFITGESERIQINIRLDIIMFITGTTVVLFLALSLLTSCIYTFECSEFLPTISYLASFRLYDRWIVFTLSLMVIPLLIFFYSAFLTYREYIRRADSWVLLVISVIVAFILPLVVVIDEISSSWYFPLDKLHVIILGSFVTIVCVWVVFSLEWLFKMYLKNPCKFIIFNAGYVVVCLVCVGIEYYQWKVSDREGTYVLLALIEYLDIVLFAYLPRVYCGTITNVCISLENLKVHYRD